LIIQRVQDYIDPDTDGDGKGDGLGEGVAEIGAHFTAVKPSTLSITVSATVQLAYGFTIEDVTAELSEAISLYLKNAIVESNDDTSTPVIRYNAIGSILIESDGVLDYSNLLLNGGTENIQPDIDEVGLLESLILTAES
jgi:uncharacterized phage protein gp47/JayE